MQDMVDDAASNAAANTAVSAADAEDIKGRISHLEAGCRKLSDGQAALDKAVEVLTQSVPEGGDGVAVVAGEGGVAVAQQSEALRAVAAKVAQLEEMVTALAPQVRGNWACC